MRVPYHLKSPYTMSRWKYIRQLFRRHLSKSARAFQDESVLVAQLTTPTYEPPTTTTFLRAIVVFVCLEFCE